MRFFICLHTLIKQRSFTSTEKMSTLDQALSRQNGTNNAATKMFSPGNKIPQYTARQFRGQYREDMMQTNSQDVQERRNALSAQQYVQTQKQQTPNATMQLDGTERFDQVNARKEKYGDSCFTANCFGNGEAYSDAPVSCSNPCLGGAKSVVSPRSSMRSSTNDHQVGRLPCSGRPQSICQRGISALDKRDYNSSQTLAYQTHVNDTLRRQHPLANGDIQTPGMQINAVQAEKESYADSHTDGNEEAYAHVEALKNSIRGYKDTSEKTVAALKVQNAREAARFGGIGTASAY